MCILFIYVGTSDEESDYSLILVSNRDEYFSRPSLNMAPWAEDPDVVGGRDLQPGCDCGTWLAMSPSRKKVGVLLNISGNSNPNLKSRGKIVADYLRCEKTTEEYIKYIKDYIKETNNFLFVTVEFINLKPVVQAYSNETDLFYAFTENYYAFGNSLPTTPLKKVDSGKSQFKKICSEFHKVNMKQELISHIVQFLKSEEKHLPDPELKKRRPEYYEQLSSIFVKVPEGTYGSRTHTLMLVTKTGHMDVIEITLKSPIDPENPQWETTELQYDV